MSSLEDKLADPQWFPSNADLRSRTLTLTPTTRSRLASEPFIDGRSDFSIGPAIEVDLARVLPMVAAPVTEPDRMIFHMGFCGSTLLATLLDQPGQVLSLREPNVLADLANAKRSGASVGGPLQLARGLLSRPLSPGERTVCKASNWVNNLLPEFTGEPAAVRPLFMTISPEEFLRAAFRGGRDRLAFLIQLASHLMSAGHGGELLWSQSSQPTADPLDRAARLVLAAHEMQSRLFKAALQAGNWSNEHVIDFVELEADLAGAVEKAALALQLPLNKAAIGAIIARHAGRHAKQKGASFSADRRTAENQLVQQHHGQRIDAALTWAASTFAS